MTTATSPLPAHRHPHAEVWRIAVPAMATNAATGMIGVVDTWVMGQTGSAVALAAAGAGAMLVVTLITLFNFLRMGTTGLAARAHGAGDRAGRDAVLVRGLAAALALGGLLLVARPLVLGWGVDLLGAGADVAAGTRHYLGIRWWGAPLMLANMALTGWLLGLQRARAVLGLELVYNAVNAGLSVWLGLVLGQGIAGIALASLIAEAVKAALAVGLVRGSSPLDGLRMAARARSTWDSGALVALFRTNRDLLARTALLMLCVFLLTRVGARLGAVTLAGNTVLWQFFILSALVLDGFEAAGQTLCGAARGAGDEAGFSRLVRATFMGAGMAAMVIALVYAVAGPALILGFARDAAAAASARAHLGWAVLLPLAGVWSFVFDGIYIGAGWSRAMMLTMAAGALAFVAALAALVPALGNHGLWAAFTLLMLVRGLGQAWAYPRLRRH